MRFIGYIGISGTPLLAEFFLHSYEADFIQTLVREKIKTLAVAYYSGISTKYYQSTILTYILTSTRYIPVNLK